MRTYFVSFRIADSGDPGPVYDGLHKLIEGIAQNGKWWFETTSFYLFDSEFSVDHLANLLSAEIRLDRDILVVGSLTHKVGCVIGKCDDPDIFDFVPFMKKV